MVEITLKGREIPLVYTVLEMKAVQEEVAPLGKLMYLLSGRNPEDEKDTSRYAGPEHIGAIAKMVRILGNAGLEEAGEEPDLTDKWVMRALRPAEIPAALNAVMEALNEGMASEIPPKNDGEPVDVTLDRLNKKKAKGS
jgi:hypothetical protein